MDFEDWRDVPGYDGKFQISITTKEGKCRNTNWRGTGETKELPNTVLSNGRINWNLNHIVKQSACWIALTYPELIENEYFEGAEIDHKDTDPLNNQPSNLHWVTRSGNMSNPMTVQKIRNNQTGKCNSMYGSGERQQNRVDQSKPVVQYSIDEKFVAWFPSSMEAERVLGIPKLNARISECCRGKRKTARGYIWRFA